MKVIINLGRGNLHEGCNHVVVRLIDCQGKDRQQLSGILPPAPQIAALYQQWQTGYRAFYKEATLRIGLLESEGARYSATNFQQVCRQIAKELNSWLSSDRFLIVEKVLRTRLPHQKPIQLIITAAEPELQRLPWHLWHLLDDYPQAEITFSNPDWHAVQHQSRKGSRIRILAILGNSTGLDLKSDLDAIIALPQTELTILTQPSMAELNEHLWQTAGWDLLLFSGHSSSNLTTGYIYLNDTEKITLTRLKYSLQKAIANGLQIAIFNSCEGVGLALQLADLSLPYTVVMNEPVPDRIAQLFLQYFLTAFTMGKTFSLAVKEARQKLVGWETEFVCASWLPTIWQNPTVKDIEWQDFQTQSQTKYRHKLSKIALLSSLAVSGSIVLLRALGWLEPLELWAYDSLMKQRPPETIDPRIVVVEITEEDTNRDRYPISDRVLVEAIELLNKHRPVAIGLDLHRSYERGAETEYRDLIELFTTNSHIFPVCSYGANNNSYAPPAGLSVNKRQQQMGFSDLLIDGRQPSSDNSRLDLSDRDMGQIQNPSIRRQLLSYEPDLATSTSQCITPYSLSFQLAFEYLQQAKITPLQVNEQQQWQLGKAVFAEMPRRFGAYQQLDGQSSQIMLNYRSGEPGKRITLTQLRSGEIAPRQISDRIVLIGYSASVARDYFNTPYGAMPGVWVHAHQTSQIISAAENERSLIWALPQWGDLFYILIWLLFWGIILVTLGRKHLIYSLFAFGVVLLSIHQISLSVMIRGGWLPYIPIIFALTIITIIMAIARIVFLEKIKKQS